MIQLTATRGNAGMDNLIGQQIDNYRIEMLLGEGGMGAVYRAQDIHLNRPVALKMISPRLARNPDFQRRFLQEARAAARLKHPSIVQIYHFSGRQGLLYMAMSYIPGQALGTYIRRLQKSERVIMLSESLILTAQIAEALGYAHRQGVVHRDIKPDNILLEPLDAPERSGEPAIRAVITDFGLAKLLEGGLETQTNTFLGTLPYMSPEQCRGRDIDGRSDIYSLGILLYQLATGRLPFDIRSIGDAAEKHIRATPPSPLEIRPDLPPVVAEVILKAIAKQPEERFQTGEDMARTLRSVPIDATKIMTFAQTTIHETVSLVTQLLPDVSTLDPPSIAVGLTEPGSGDYLIIQQQGKADYTVTLDKAVIVMGRSQACDIVLDTPGVSRQHARLERTSSGWQISDMGSSNGTWVKDSQLLPNIPESWEPGSVARVGPYFIRWQQGIGPVGWPTHRDAHVQAGSKSGVTQIMTMDGQLSVLINPVNAEVKPGGLTEVQVTLFNQGISVDHFELRVSGLPAEWVTLPAESVQLMPGSSSSLSLTLHPPQDSSARAGRHPYQLWLYSASAQKPIATIDGSVTVAPFTSFTCEARPTLLRNKGSCHISLQNKGNNEAVFTLSASDPGEMVQFLVEQETVSLQPGQSQQLALHVKPKSRPMFGKTERHDFQLKVQTADKLKETPGVLEVKPRIPAWVITLIPFLVVLCGVGAIFGPSLWIDQREQTVPDVIGLTQNDALATLEAAAFSPRQGGEEFSTVLPGLVARTDPEANTPATPGSRVVWFLSAGPTPTDTPIPTDTPAPMPALTTTDTPTPTETSIPTDTPTPMPTATATDTPMPTETPTPVNNRPIVFDSTRHGQLPQIYIMNADGTDQRRLTSNRWRDDEADLSPDEQWIAFTRQEGEPDTKTVWVMRNDGSDDRSLVSGQNPDWSPDGRYLAYETLDNPSHIRIYDMNSDTSRQLTSGSRSYRAPDWSPDGQEIVAMSPVGSTWQLFIINIATGVARQVTSDDGDKRFPAWSPDGSLIAYNTLDNRNWPENIWVIEPSGTGARQITDSGNSGRPTWSPDSQLLVFNSYINQRWVLYQVNLNRQQGQQLTTVGHDQRARWSN
jgi:serine/threonine protein kinase/Tol biopolymer transport system component